MRVTPPRPTPLRVTLRLTAMAVVLGLVVAGHATPALAQGGVSSMRGTVVDQGKAVLPGVTVTATNEATNLERETVTGPKGQFVLPTMIPGTYTLTATLSGFQTVTRKGLQLQVGQEVTLDLTLLLAGVQETVTVTGQALVDTTSSRIGTNITSTNIDSLPSEGRNQLSLMQTIPGLTPALNPGSFEGGQFNANGQATTNNLFLVDGAYDNDSRRGGSQGTQARIALDAMAEYQVQTHTYNAEYGGSTGVIVNSVTKSGTNTFAGRVFEYYRDNALQATNYFLKKEGEKNPDFGSNVYGGSIGGPIVKNHAFFFFNLEETRSSEAANLNFPADAAPLATSYSTTTAFTGPNTLLRLDYHPSSSHQLSFSWTREAILTTHDEIADNASILDNATNENDAGDQVFTMAWNWILNNRATNQFRVNHVTESLLQGPDLLFDDNWKFIGFHGVDPLEIPSVNAHPDYNAGPANNYNQDLIRDYGVSDNLTLIRSAAGEHTIKAGFKFSRNAALPQGRASNFTGEFGFGTNRPFNAADPTTYPRRFQINMGQRDFNEIDHRVGAYVQDAWTLDRLTLNLGVRYDWQKATPDTTDAIGPRVGFAYDVLGDGNTVIRGGAGKVYQYQTLAVLATLLQDSVIAPANEYDTGQVTSPSVTGTFPMKTGDPDATACLNMVAGPVAGEGVMSPACRAFLENRRDQVNAGGFVNDQPTVDGNRQMAYTWAYSVGVEHQLTDYMALSVDFAGNRGRDNTAIIDINEGPVGSDGRITRLGVNTFDPSGNLVPLSNADARATAFRTFGQYQTLSALNTDFDSLELSLKKRMEHRWSGRVSYTLSRCHDVGAIIVDSDPRLDYGRCDRDNTQALAASASVNIWKGLGAGFVFRAYSGNPINETVGSDVNGDLVNNDRPVKGIDDAERPILSALDSRGVAVRNGIDGEKQVLLDGRFQYVWPVQRYQAGFFLELYNLTNRVNYANPTGNRNSSQFMVLRRAGEGRSAQLGFRLTF